MGKFLGSPDLARVECSVSHALCKADQTIEAFHELFKRIIDLSCIGLTDNQFSQLVLRYVVDRGNPIEIVIINRCH